jgi:hypothetical protein
MYVCINLRRKRNFVFTKRILKFEPLFFKTEKIKKMVVFSARPFMTMASETSRLVDHNLSVKTVSWLKFRNKK